MTSGKKARAERRATDETEAPGPVRRPPAKRVLPPGVAREVRHDRNRGVRKGFAFWQSLTPTQRKEIQEEAAAKAAAEQEEEPK